MRLFLFGDVHFGESKFSSVGEEQWGFMEWVGGVVEKYGVDGIVFLGDRFVKRDPEGWIRDLGERMFVEMAKLVKQVVVVCGNHDYYTKFDKTSSFDLLSSFVGNVTVVKDGVVVNVGGVDIGVLPWDDVERWREALYLFPKQVQLVVGHVEMGFLQWSRGRGLSFDDFSCLPNLKLVVSGHVHSFTRKPMGNGGDFLYLGVPFERSLGDDSSVGGVVVEFDDNDGRLLRWEKVPGYGPQVVRFVGGEVEGYRGKVVVVEGSRYRDVTGVVGALEGVAREVLVVIGREERYGYDEVLDFEFGEDSEVYREVQLLKSSFRSVNHEKMLVDWAKGKGFPEEEIAWAVKVLEEV